MIYIVLFYFCVFRDYLEDVIPLLKYADEALALMAVPLFLFHLINRGFKLKVGRGGTHYG